MTLLWIVLCPRFSCVHVVFVSTFLLWATYYSMTVLCEVGIVEDQQLENPFTIVFDVDLINWAHSYVKRWKGEDLGFWQVLYD